jgi:RNA-directed DNA polymerase
LIILIEYIASDRILDQAYVWLCKRRANLSHNNDVWDLRRNWHDVKPKLQQALLMGEYRFSPLVELRFPDGNLECWCAVDSLILKAMVIVLGKHLAPVVSPACVHVVGHGGAKKAVRDVYRHLEPGSHVMKSDVKSYYASIDHMLLFESLHEYITDRHVLSLLWQYLKRTVCYGENYRDVSKGISLGYPLSPLMGAMFLKPLDDVMQGCGLFYVRFMDDWLVITSTRWKLRRAVRKTNEVLAALRVEQHPDKTFIGKAGFQS